MRIAVCLPQVPFARGGAEILADNLVEQLRARGHEAETRHGAVQVVPGHARADPRARSGGCSTSRRSTAGRSTS